MYRGQEIKEEEVVEGFDLRVTHRDPKTGLVTHTDPYILRVIGDGDNGGRSRLWERPAGSGNCWDKQGNPIGRWVYEEKEINGKKIRTGHYDPKAEHVHWEKPLTEDQKLAKEVLTKDAKIVELERELAAIKAESEKKSAPPQAQASKKPGA